jgi:hypothetical protein
MQSCRFNANCELQEYPSPDDGSGPACTAIGHKKCKNVRECPYKLDQNLYII